MQTNTSSSKTNQDLKKKNSDEVEKILKPFKEKVRKGKLVARCKNGRVTYFK